MYNEKIKQNMERMGTQPGEWKALPVVGFAKSEDAKGREVSMPVFDFSLMAGYVQPDTAYPCGNVDANCELCGHPIKRVFHLYNPLRGFKLIVGSECVTHFNDGVSGEEQLRLERIKAAKELDTRMADLYDRFRAATTYQERPSRVWTKGRTIYQAFHVKWENVTDAQVQAFKTLGIHACGYLHSKRILDAIAKCFVRHGWWVANEGVEAADKNLLSWYSRMGEGAKAVGLEEAVGVFMTVVGITLKND